MEIKNKRNFFLTFFSLIIILFSINLSLAKIEIKKQTITESVIKEFNNPAVFSIEITNLDGYDTFYVYSLAGVNFEEKKFDLSPLEKKTLTLNIYPTESVLEKETIYPFVLKIKSLTKNEIKEEILNIKIFTLDRALILSVNNIYLDDNQARIYIKNNADIPINNINARIYSSFFDFEKKFDLKPLETKEFIVPLDKEKIKVLQAGIYTVLAEVSVEENKFILKNSFKFEEKSILETREHKEGFLIKKYKIEKENLGNTPIVTEIIMKKDILSRLFTTFNADPSQVKREGFFIYYTFKKEVLPSTIFNVTATTNYIYLIIIVIILIILLRILFVYSSSQIILRKNVKYVKTKGGEFALQIKLSVRAKKFVERITIFDKLPYSFNLFKELKGEMPKRIDEQNKRIEWYIESLQPGEERVYSYIIFNRIAPVGKFELPPAKAIYEREGRIKEAISNKTFFVH
ncbi:MAG: hypothetical protein QW117_02630 [Candidatus Pacearchaeota archaeon]